MSFVESFNFLLAFFMFVLCSTPSVDDPEMEETGGWPEVEVAVDDAPKLYGFWVYKSLWNTL